MSNIIPFGLLSYTPLEKIGDTQIIYESGKIWNYGTTICESDQPLTLTLPNGEISSTKKIFSDVTTKIKFEGGEINLDASKNLIELIFTHTGWTLLNGETKNIKALYLESKEPLNDYKILGNNIFVVLHNKEKILIFKGGKPVRTLQFEGIKKIEISGDWLFILTNTFQYYDITFNKICPVDLKVDDLRTQNSKFQLTLKINGNWSFYQYDDLKWQHKSNVRDDTVKVFNLMEVPTLVYFEGRQLIETPLNGITKKLELGSSKNLGIWQFEETVIILYISDGKFICNINFNKQVILDLPIVGDQVDLLNYTPNFLVLRVGSMLKIFGGPQFIQTLNRELGSNEYQIFDKIYDISGDNVYSSHIFFN